MTLTIRHAGPGDEAAIVDLVRQYADAMGEVNRVDDRDVRRYLAAPDTTILLATDKRQPVGMLSYAIRPSLYHAGDSGEIELFVVDETRRGEGIGRRLLAAALRLMQEAGCVEISVSVDPDDEAAQDLYFDLGLTEATLRLERHLRS